MPYVRLHRRSHDVFCFVSMRSTDLRFNVFNLQTTASSKACPYLFSISLSNQALLQSSTPHSYALQGKTTSKISNQLFIPLLFSFLAHCTYSLGTQFAKHRACVLLLCRTQSFHSYDSVGSAILSFSSLFSHILSFSDYTTSSVLQKPLVFHRQLPHALVYIQLN